MHALLPCLSQWLREGKSAALATVVKVWGSAPRPIGSKMAVSSAGEMQGSVSGGCVEGAVFEGARDVMTTGRPRLLRFGVSDETAWSVGLSCGGEIEVYVEPFVLRADHEDQSGLPDQSDQDEAAIGIALVSALADDRTIVRATIVGGPGLGRRLLIDPSGAILAGGLGRSDLDAHARSDAATLLPSFGCRKASHDTEDGVVDLFVEVHGPQPQLVLVGAVHVAIPLVHLAKLLGYRTVVVDPRPVFATADRFGHADVLLVEWPDEAFAKVRLHDRTAVAVLSHDLKIDVPALTAALRHRLTYIGALGSKKTQAKRHTALLDAGVSEEDIARVRSPIGLDLGGRKAEEVALAIMAEIVAVTSGAAVGRTPLLPSAAQGHKAPASE